MEFAHNFTFLNFFGSLGAFKEIFNVSIYAPLLEIIYKPKAFVNTQIGCTCSVRGRKCTYRGWGAVG